MAEILNPFIQVIDALNRADVRYVIVGGFAAVMHGSNRVTADLDVVIDLQEQEAKKTIAALLQIGLRPRAPVDPYLFADPAQRQKWITDKGMMVFTMLDPLSRIPDIALFVEPPSMGFEQLFARSVVIQLSGRLTRISAISDLIALKEKAGRPVDRLDIDNLRLIQSRQDSSGAGT